MFELELFPAREGDALILTWGDPARPYRLLIDAGRESTADALMEHARKARWEKDVFELFIITHIDRDHIEGAQHLLRDDAFRALIKAVWFNGRADLETRSTGDGFEAFSALHGERVSRMLREHGVPWNEGWNDGPVAVVDEVLPRVDLAGGMQITLLSPDLKQLAALAGDWDETVAEAKPGWEVFGDESIDIDFQASRKFKSDAAKPNGSSIAFIAEYEGRRILMGADAHNSRLLKSLDLYDAASGAGPIHLVKAPHHGSKANVSKDLVERCGAAHWVFSTNGDQFRHPDLEGVARAIRYAPKPVKVYFNYESDETRVWRGETKPAYDFSTIYGDAGYLTIDLMALETPSLG